MLDHMLLLIQYHCIFSNCTFCTLRYLFQNGRRWFKSDTLSFASNDEWERALNCNLTTILFKPNVRRNVHDTTQTVQEEVLTTEKNLKKKMIRILMKFKYKDTLRKNRILYYWKRNPRRNSFLFCQRLKQQVKVLLNSSG